MLLLTGHVLYCPLSILFQRGSGYADCVITLLCGNCCLCPGVSRAVSYAKRVQTMSGGRPVIAPVRDEVHLGQVVPEVAAAVAAVTA